MTKYDIYIGTDGNEATSHGAEYVHYGLNPADAVSRFISESHDEIRNADEVCAFDGDMTATAFLAADGTWELHVSDGESDVAVTLPAVDYVSISEASELLGITRQRVHVMLQRGQLAGRMVGNAWIVSRASVMARGK